MVIDTGNYQLYRYFKALDEKNQKNFLGKNVSVSAHPPAVGNRRLEFNSGSERPGLFRRLAVFFQDRKESE